MHALVGVDLFLHRDLVGCAGLEAPADTDVHPLGVLAKDDEVDVGAATVLERTQPVGEQGDGPVVDVEVELEPRAEQDVPGVPVVGHAGIAHRAEEDRGVVVAQPAIAVGGHRLASRKEMIGAPREAVQFERHGRCAG